MQRFIRFGAKGYRFIHRILVCIYLGLKRVFLNTKWHLKEKKNDYEALKSLGDIELFPISINSWHLGNSFFKCINNDNEYFVKKVQNSFLANREIEFYSCLDDIRYASLRQYIPQLHSTMCQGSSTYIVLEFIPWETINKYTYKKISENDRCNYVLILFDIFELLWNLEYVHNDIRKENFFIHDGKIIMFDFGYALKYRDRDELIKTLSKNELSRINEHNRPSSKYIDDAFSMLNVMKAINPEMYNNQHDIWVKMNCYIGERIVSIEG